MALFTDGKLASIDDLKEYESAVLQTAGIEGIDISAKLKLAYRGIGFEITAYLSRHGMAAPGDLGRVVVSEALLHWHCLHTLELIYCDAYNSQVNDRYLGKWKEYSLAANRARATAMGLGIGVVSGPVAKAPASPAVTAEPGGVLGTRTYYITVSWQGANGFAGVQSDPVVITAPLSTLVSVDAGLAPANATGWHVYAGESDRDLRRQNLLPLAPGSSWVEPMAGLRSDLSSVPVQSADWHVRNNRILQRG